MKKVNLLLLLTLLSIAFVYADAGDILYEGILVFGNTSTAPIGTDTNASSICTGATVLLGNATCEPISNYLGGGGQISNNSISVWTNDTFGTYNYNMTVDGELVYNHTATLITLYGANWNNHTATLISQYGSWWNNQTAPAITYADTVSSGVNDTANLQTLLNGTYAFLGSENITINSSLAIMWAGSSGASGGAEISNASLSVFINDTTTNYFPSQINLTTSTFNGEITNGSLVGYKAANSYCANNYTGSHLCTEHEVMAWYANEDWPTALDDDAWVIAGGPKYVPASIPVNDCNGWTYSGTSDYLGNYWHFNSTTGGDPRAINCGTALALACCTY